MNWRKRLSILVVLFLAFIPTVFAGEQPLAIFHAFNDPFALVESYVCELAGQGTHTSRYLQRRSRTLLEPGMLEVA